MADQQPSEPQNEKNTLDPLSLVDDYEEVVTIDGKTERRKGIYLLPNLFTTAALFAGFFAIIVSSEGRFEAAAIAIFAAMIFDGLDGRVARITNTQSRFGAEYDSLADMVSFGVAPALVMFNWSLNSLGKVGWAVAFIYIACAALRLARFNTQRESADLNSFTGLASPSAAALVAGIVWVAQEEGWIAHALPYELSILCVAVTAVAGFLMILNIPYNSFKAIDLKGRVPFPMLLLVVVVFGLITLNPARVLLAMAVIYALSGPLAFIVRFLKGGRSA